MLINFVGKYVFLYLAVIIIINDLITLSNSEPVFDWPTWELYKTV